jgi:hypothetical protein
LRGVDFDFILMCFPLKSILFLSCQRDSEWRL